MLGNTRSGVVVDDDEVHIAGLEAGGSQSAARSMLGEIASRFLILGDTALADAGAFDDPRIGRVHHFLEGGIGEHARGQIAAGTQYSGVKAFAAA